MQLCRINLKVMERAGCARELWSVIASKISPTKVGSEPSILPVWSKLVWSRPRARRESGNGRGIHGFVFLSKDRKIWLK